MDCCEENSTNLIFLLSLIPEILSVKYELKIELLLQLSHDMPTEFWFLVLTVLSIDACGNTDDTSL